MDSGVIMKQKQERYTQRQRIKDMLQISLESESHLSWRELMKALSRFQQKLIVIIHEHPIADVETIAKYSFEKSQTVSPILRILKDYDLIKRTVDPFDQRRSCYQIKHAGLHRCLEGYGLKY